MLPGHQVLGTRAGGCAAMGWSRNLRSRLRFFDVANWLGVDQNHDLPKWMV